MGSSSSNSARPQGQWATMASGGNPFVANARDQMQNAYASASSPAGGQQLYGAMPQLQRQQIASAAPQGAQIDAYGKYVNPDGTPFAYPTPTGAIGGQGGVLGAVRGGLPAPAGADATGRGGHDKGSQGPRREPGPTPQRPQGGIIQRPVMGGPESGFPFGGNLLSMQQGQALSPEQYARLNAIQPRADGYQKLLQSYDLTGMPANLKGF